MQHFNPSPPCVAMACFSSSKMRYIPKEYQNIKNQFFLHKTDPS